MLQACGPLCIWGKGKGIRYAVGSFEPADPGQFHDILVEDCAVDGTDKAAIEIDGLPEMPHRSITFRNIRFTRTHENIVNNAQDIVCENVTYDYAK